MSSTGTATMLMPVIIAASPRYAPGDRASTSGAVPDPARLAGAASGHPGQAAKQVRCVAGWLSEAAQRSSTTSKRDVELPGCLRDSPASSCAIDRENGPSVAVVVTEMHQEGLSVVLDPQPMFGVAPPRERSAPGCLRSRQRRRSSACELRSGSSAARGQRREEVDDIPIRILDLR